MNSVYSSLPAFWIISGSFLADSPTETTKFESGCWTVAPEQRSNKTLRNWCCIFIHSPIISITICDLELNQLLLNDASNHFHNISLCLSFAVPHPHMRNVTSNLFYFMLDISYIQSFFLKCHFNEVSHQLASSRPKVPFLETCRWSFGPLPWTTYGFVFACHHPVDGLMSFMGKKSLYQHGVNQHLISNINKVLHLRTSKVSIYHLWPDFLQFFFGRSQLLEPNQSLSCHVTDASSSTSTKKRQSLTMMLSSGCGALKTCGKKVSHFHPRNPCSSLQQG